MVTQRAGIALFLLTLGTIVNGQEAREETDNPLVFFESYPSQIQARLERRERVIQRQLAKEGRDELEGLVEIGKVWEPGSTVTVAFRGGTDDLCKRIADVAHRWTEHGNLKFSFRTDDGEIRRWTRNDRDFAGDIRISFNQDGFFSLVGTDSSDEQIIRPNQASMNFEGFDIGLPRGWQGVVLHEFGHALGFHHEHQHPVVPCDFRFEDDPGYEPTTDSAGQFIPDDDGDRPGVYTVLGGPPNEWPRHVVDHNLRALENDSSMFLISAFDPKSIMKYDLEDWMFSAGQRSHCFTGRRNEELSDVDKRVFLQAYPESSDAIEERREAIEAFEQLKE